MIRRILPILEWASRYRRAWLRPDLIAGLTVAALVVPKSLGYAAGEAHAVKWLGP